MNVIGYTRVSTAGQADNGISLQAQRIKIEQWCKLHEHALAHVYCDAGISGKAINTRPQLGEAMRHAYQERGTIFLVYSLSRLARSITDLMRISERLEKAGVELVSLCEVIDTTTAAGKMVFRLMAVLNQFEREQIGERTKMALQALRAQGKRIGDKIPYGWKDDPNSPKNAVGRSTGVLRDKKEQARILMILGMRQQGNTLREIAGYFNRHNIPNRGRKWKHWQIQRILSRHYDL